jgi:hypothetical protein
MTTCKRVKIKVSMKKLSTFLALLSTLAIQAQEPFTPGSIVVVRVGVSDSTLPAGSSPVFLEEFSANGNHLQTIPIPYEGDAKLTIGGRTITEGVLRRSANGAFLTLGGYNLVPGVSSPTSTSTGADRSIARIGVNGIIDLTNRLPIDSLYPNAAFRAVVSDDGSRFWTAGGSQGVRFFEDGHISTTLITNTSTNLRGLDIQFGNLFYGHGAGLINTRIMQVGENIPDTPGVAATPLPGLPTSNSAGCDFFFADLNNQIEGPDVLYFADDLSGLRKYSLVEGIWQLNSITGTGADVFRGLTGMPFPGGVMLYTTFRAGNQAVGGGQLGVLVDLSGYNQPMTATPQTLAIAETNTGFRGVALSPISAPFTPETYIFTGNGKWSHPGNWLDSKMPPTALPAGDRIIIIPGEEGVCVLDLAQTIEPGAIFIIQAEGKFVVEGNLELK